MLRKSVFTVFGFCMMLAVSLTATQGANAQELNTVWERTSRTGAAEAKPSWFTIGSVRGMAYHNGHVYAADRTNNTIQIMDAATGADITPATAFDLSGVTGGTLTMNDVEVSEDGVIFLGNLGGADTPFRLYWWNEEGGAYADSVTIPVADRTGDKFTVIGSLADNTIEVWLPVASVDPGVIYVATTADQGANWDIETITLTGANTIVGSSVDVAPLALGRTSDFYIGGNSSAPARYTSAGEFIADSDLDYASRNGMEAFQLEGKDHLAVYTYRPDGSTLEKTGRINVYDVSVAASPTLVAQSPLMGDDVDSYSSIHGEAEIMVNEDGTYNVFALEGVNGLAAFTNAEKPEPVAVTFVVNTATLADTVMPTHLVQMRGTTMGPNGTDIGITWGDDTALIGTNVGGDYWEFNFDMMPGDTVEYKFWTGVDKDNPLGGGWESSNNRKFALDSEATGELKAPVHYFNRETSPFAVKADTIGVLFRVNVGAQIQLGNFDPESHTVSVRGGYAPLGWDDTTVKLDAEGNSPGENAIYSKIVYFNADSLLKYTPFNYKFFLDNGSGDGGYETTADRPFNITNAADTTLHIVNFSNKAPIQGTVLETNLNFEVNVGILEGLGFFNATIDTVYVRGDFNGFGTQDMMTFNSFSGTFEKGSIPYTSTVDANVGYKYYIKWDKRRDEEASEFYLSGITHDGSGWEEPGVTGGANRTFNLIDDANQPVRSEFYNSVEPKALITSANADGGSVTVTFSVDMSPALDANNTSTVFNPASDSVFLFVDTPFFALTNNITVPGDDGGKFGTITPEERDRLRFTDEDSDGIYTLDLDLTLPTLNNIGFRIAYGEPTSESGSLIINGGGFESGRRHYQYIQPQVDGSGNVTWPSTYTFPTLTWKKDDLPWENPPTYNATSNEEEIDGANTFSLDQNYPNPFNPTTNIKFNLANTANVTLSVYNVLGQKVATLANNVRYTSGSHIVSFDAKDLASGVYLYRIEAGNFVSQKRMTLIK